MAGPACRAELRRRGSAGWCVVRIMAHDAGQLPGAPQKALRLAQPVCGADDLELAVVAGTSRMIEVHDVIVQALARPKRVGRAREARNRLRQPSAGDFEMALLADVHLLRGGQPSRI